MWAQLTEVKIKLLLVLGRTSPLGNSKPQRPAFLIVLNTFLEITQQNLLVIYIQTANRWKAFIKIQNICTRLLKELCIHCFDLVF